jgi:hypothetical protein
VDNEAIHNLFAMPNATDMWEGDSTLFSKFGLQNLDSISLFIAKEEMEKLHPELVNRDGKASVDNLPNGNLVVFDNNKIMEVTNFDLASADFGNNNVFTSNRDKNVYKLTLKSYFFNHDDIQKGKDISSTEKFDYEDFGNLSKIFESEEEEHTEVTDRTEEKVIEDEIIYPNPARKTPIRDKKAEENPFGYLG